MAARSQRRADESATRDVGASRRAPATGATANGRATIAHLADEVLPMLIARLGASGLGELEVRQDGWRVRLRRPAQPGTTDATPQAPAGGHPRSSAAPRSSERREAATAATAPEAPARRERGRVAISSPGVGYYQPREGLAVGASVRSGDLLGHVDVLGVRQQVVAPENGVLATLAAEAGEAVEYGQTLARLEPEERG